MLKRCLSFPLWLSLLLGVCGVLAEGAAPEDPASIDELPFLVQSRPDMSIPAPLKVTFGEGVVLFAPESGEDEHELVLFVKEGSKRASYATWNQQEKAYAYKSEERLHPPMLTGARLFTQKNLQMDSSISEQLRNVILQYTFDAASGRCLHVAYTVDIATNGRMSGHVLIHYNDGSYLAYVNGENHMLFDASGRRIPFPPPMTPPDSLAELAGLPDMSVPGIRYHWAQHPLEPLRVETDEAWDAVTVTLKTPDTSVTDWFTYDEAEQAWLTAPLSELKLNEGLTEVQQRGTYTEEEVDMHIIVRRRSEHDMLQVEVPVPERVFYPKIGGYSYDLIAAENETAVITYARRNSIQKVVLQAVRTQHNVHVTFHDYLGRQTAEKNYPVEPQ